MKQRVEKCLEQALFERVATARELGRPYELLWENIADVALVGGKRIRPYLTAVGYGACDEVIIPVATAQELLHIAMLMHDDVIDQDVERHGVANINGIYQGRYRTYLSPSLATHYANGAGILAGDLLLSEAYRLVSRTTFGDSVKQNVLEQLATSVYEVVGGELLDVEAGFVTDEPFDPMNIYRYKTASYSFMGPLLAGGHCAELSESELVVLSGFGEKIGIAFQIQDDILGVVGDKQKTGKATTTADLREGKQTLLSVYHRELSEGDARMRENLLAFGKHDATEEALQVIAEDMAKSGALEKTKKVAEDYFAQAERYLQDMSGIRQQELASLVASLRDREY